MRLLKRIMDWAYPSVPESQSTSIVPVQSTLDSRAALAMQRYSSVANALSDIRIGKAVWPDRDPSVYDTEGYRKLSLVYRCTNIVAYASGVAPLRVYDEATDDDEVPDHPLRKLVRQPNPTQGEALFWSNVTVRTAIAGFCVVEKERNSLGTVIALNPLRSSWLKAVPIGRGVYDWEYRVPGVATPYRLKAADVVVFRWSDTPDGSPYGIGPIATAIRDASILTKMADFLGVLFERGGVPLYGLIPADGMVIQDQAQADAMVEGFVQRRGGLARAGIPMVLEGVKSVERLQMDLDELAYTDLRDVSELEIVRAFGVPPRKAITRVGLEHTTQNATASVEDGEFYRDAIVPLWTRYDDAMTTALLPDFEPMPTTRYLGFDTSDVQALQEDRNAKASWVVQGFAGSLFSQHTAYRELGIPLPETPDFYLRSIAVEAIPADDPLGLTVAATPTTTTTGTPTTTTTSPPQLGSVRIVALGTGPTDRLARRKAIGAHNRKAIVKVADARTPSLHAFLTAQAERIAAQVKAPVGVGLVAVGRNGHAAQAPPETLAMRDIDWTAEGRRMLDELGSLFRLAGETAFAAASTQLGVALDWSLARPRVRGLLDRLGFRAAPIVEETRQTVAAIVRAGLDAGKRTAEIADDLRASHAFSEARAMTIARTESTIAYGEATVLGYRESGIVDRVQVWDNPDHDVDYGSSDGMTCAERDGIVVSLDEAMSHVEADHPNGSARLSPVLTGED